MRKINYFFLIILVSFMFYIPNVQADTLYGTVKDITEAAGDSLTTGKGELEVKGDTTYIRYSSATFQMLKEDKSATDGQRPGPAAWIGFQIDEPKGGDNNFKVTLPNNTTTQINNSVYKDYVGITPDNLKNSILNDKPLTYKYSFDWDENNTQDQFVVIEVDPLKVTLLSENKQRVWTPEIAQDILIQNRKANPNTSDINIYLYIIILLISSGGLLYCIKK